MSRSASKTWVPKNNVALDNPRNERKNREMDGANPQTRKPATGRGEEYYQMQPHSKRAAILQAIRISLAWQLCHPPYCMGKLLRYGTSRGCEDRVGARGIGLLALVAVSAVRLVPVSCPPSRLAPMRSQNLPGKDLAACVRCTSTLVLVKLARAIIP